jgi:hypothetical protein
MTDTLPTQEQVDRVAKELAPDVVRIKMLRTRDHDGDRILEFLVLMADEAAPPGKVHPLAQRVRAKLKQELGLDNLEDYYATYSFRRTSEQETLREKRWE